MATKAELIKRCEELGINPEPLTNNAQREAAIKAAEAELAASVDVEDPELVQEESAKESAESAESAGEPNDNPEPESVGTYEDAQGRKWGFKSFAPKTININGHIMTQQEILETEEVISELVYGNCTFLTQKQK